MSVKKIVAAWFAASLFLALCTGESDVEVVIAAFANLLAAYLAARKFVPEMFYRQLHSK